MTIATKPIPMPTSSQKEKSAQDIPDKSTALRELLTNPSLDFIMEAHDGISAKIVEEAGFKGIWASGLTMSAALGVRDNNEASWTQVLEVLEFMADATTIPMLVDGDTGYGNFNNVRRVVRKLCQRGIAGICIEDKIFPKSNSFIGEGQPLADIEEFCGKIMAGKDSQTDDRFSLVARVEALISGRGMAEALMRADAYYAAGADAILIHSKQNSANEILTFAEEWDNRCPLVIVPTTYYTSPVQNYRDRNISLVIWANQNLRASIRSMREVSRRIHREETLIGIEEEVATVKDIFDLAGNTELADAEKRYLPKHQGALKAIILAASRGIELGKLTEDRPKCMIDIRGQPLLSRLVETMNSANVRDITVVRGYKKEMVNLPSVKTIDNDLFETNGEAASLACARDVLNDDCLIAYGDILFRQYMMDQLLTADGDIVLVVDALWRKRDPDPKSRLRDLVKCTSPFVTNYIDDGPILAQRIGPDLHAGSIDGEWIGLAKLTKPGSIAMCAALEQIKQDSFLSNASLCDLFNQLINEGQEIQVMYVTGHWLDVDNQGDLEEANSFL